MLKTLQLTTWERTQLINLVATQEGNVVQLRQWFQILDVLELSEDEKELVGWQRWQDDGICPHCKGSLPGRGQQRFMWRDSAHLFDLEFEDADFIILSQAAMTFPRWPANRLCLELLDKVSSDES